MITSNQISDTIQKQLGRPATDFETKTFATASPQTLATLKDTYGKLNTSSSITDYLKYSGQDSSPEARMALGQKYGITNIGTPEGNTALLKALKSGKTPTITPVTGSIAPQNATGTTQTPQTDTSTQTGNQPLTGTISGATPAPQDPLTQAKTTYDTAYTQAQTAQKAVADIDAILAKVKSDKMAEIARSGGVVNEASLTAEILRENEPLLAQRKQLAGEYTQANQAYQKAQADYYKAQSLSQSQQKIDIQQNQFAQKLEQSGYKKVADYVDGTKVGEHYINLNGQNVNVDPSTGVETVIGSGNSVGSSTSVVSGSPVSTTKGNVTYTDFASVPDAPTDQNRNTEYPGTEGKKYGAVYEDAVTYAETGKYQKMGQSNKPSTKAYDNAVKAKASNIAGALGMTEDQLRVAYKANSTAISKLITMKSTVAAFENKAKAQIDMILNGYTDPRTGEKVPSLNTSVSRTDYPIVNGFFVKGKLLAGDTNTQLLSNALITFSTEYAKIMSGATGSAAASSDSARQEAAGLISTALSEGTLDATLGLLQKEMDTTIQGYDTQIKELGTGFVGAKTGIGNTAISRGSMSASDFVDKALTAHNLSYDQAVKNISSQLQAGERGAIDNKTGDVVAVTEADLQSGNYTPL